MSMAATTLTCAAAECENAVNRHGARCPRCAKERRHALQLKRRHNQQGQRAPYPAGDLPASDAAELLRRIYQAQQELDRLDSLQGGSGSGVGEASDDDVQTILRSARTNLALAIQQAGRWHALNEELGDSDAITH